MNIRPIIGISASLTLDRSERFLGRRIVSLNENYINAIIYSDGIPFVLPITNNIEIIKNYARLLDGLLLSGGYDINPLNYFENPSLKLGKTLNERDEFEINLIKEFEKLDKPILGICRGNQILNVAHGGTLYQDISLIQGSFIKHNQNALEYEVTHKVTIKEDTNLIKIVGKNILVNSYHHQCIKKLGKGLKVAAISDDNVIEAVENIDGSFKLGIQWHPEMIFNKNKIMAKIFRCFLLECENNKYRL